MNQTVDFFVSDARKSSNSDKISYLTVHQFLHDDKIGEGKTEFRSDVIAKIENGYTYCTIYKDNPKEKIWKRGAKIGVVYADDGKYLRTDGNSIKKDNLGYMVD